MLQAVRRKVNLHRHSINNPAKNYLNGSPKIVTFVELFQGSGLPAEWAVGGIKWTKDVIDIMDQDPSNMVAIVGQVQ